MNKQTDFRCNKSWCTVSMLVIQCKWEISEYFSSYIIELFCNPFHFFFSTPPIWWKRKPINSKKTVRKVIEN